MAQTKKILNSEQKQAVRFGAGPLLIIAGAGTGKTTVITERIKYLVTKKGIKPAEVLALTFTEKAAREMGVPFLGRIPLDPGMVTSTDDGFPFVARNPDSTVTEAFHRISQEWRQLLAGKEEKKAKVRRM